MIRRWIRPRPKLPGRPAAWCLALLLLDATIAGGAAARQEVDAPPPAPTDTLTGRIEDQDGQPVPNWPVSLHHLNEDGSGTELASTMTDAEGTFTFGTDFSADGIYFVATRYDNTIYVGAPFRAPGPPAAEYVVAVGDPAMGLPLAGPLPEVTSEPSGLPLVGIGLIAFVFVTFFAAVRRGGVRGNWRTAALRLAELEEAYATQADSTPAHEKDLYERRREELWDRLRRRAGVR